MEASGLKQDRTEESKKVLKRAFLMASGTLTSRVLGLFRDMALAALFERSVTDAWAAAFRLPNLFRRLFGEGSLSVSFIPVFIEARQTDLHGPRAQNLVNALYTLLLIFLGTLTVLGIVYMEQVLGLLLSVQYQANPEKWLLTVRMARIMFGFVYFVCSYAYFMGILNALGSFGLPALAPALLNVSMLVFTFMPTSWFPQMGDGLAWGVLIGGVLQSGLLWLSLRARGYLPRVGRSLWNEDVKKVLVNMLPGLLGIGLLQFSTLVNLHFASGLGEGAISYVYWADRLLELPLSLVSVSLGAALLPTLSELAIAGNREHFQETVEDHFIFGFFLAWPAALGLFFLAEPIIEVLFKRGHFSAQDLAGTAIVLRVYALSLLFVSGVRILSPAFYAVRNTWVPAVTSVGALLLHVSWASWWIRRAGLEGLVVSSLLAMVLQFMVLAVCLRWKVMKINGRKMLAQFSKMILAGIALVAVLFLHSSLYRVFADSFVSKMLILVFVIVGGALAYLIAAFLLRLEQAELLISSIKRKF